MSARTSPRQNRSIHTLIAGAFVLLSALILTSCMTLVDVEGSQEQRPDVIATLTEGSEFRQTFTSRRAGLSGVELWLRPPTLDSQTAGYVKIELWTIPNGASPIAEAVFTPSQIASGGDTLSLRFPPLSDSQNTGYELLLNGIGGETQILGRFEDVYGEGTAAQDGEYLLADGAFRIRGVVEGFYCR
ncbi:MAG: hypothetical protein ACWGO1_09680, partial [Anaerolineales bacterium]